MNTCKLVLLRPVLLCIHAYPKFHFFLFLIYSDKDITDMQEGGYESEGLETQDKLQTNFSRKGSFFNKSAILGLDHRRRVLDPIVGRL